MRKLKKIIDTRLNYGRPHIKSFLRSALPYASVLDLGAGQGDDLLCAKKLNESAKLYACENYPPYVQLLTSKDISVFSVNIENERLPFDDESIDVIIVNQVFEHVKEVFWILEEISRVLSVNGRLIIGVPNLASLHNRALLLFGQQPTSLQNNSAHVRGYTLPDFKALLNSGFPGGYKLEACRGGNFYPFPAFLAKPLSSLFPRMSWAIFMNFKKTKSYSKESYLKYVIDSRLETNFFLG
jgi:SAM-dependent methyltransferase